MSNLITIPYYLGALNIEDLANLLSVKLFMKFTTDLLDNSLNNQTVTNIGNISLNSNGIILNGTSQRLETTCRFKIGYTYTIEFIYNGDTTSIGTFIGTSGTDGIVIGKENGNMCITTSGQNLISIGSISEYSNKETSYQIVLKIINSTSIIVDMYVNGNLIVSQKTINFVTNFIENINIVIGALNIAGYWYRYLNGIIGGVKITEKALDCLQFSLRRPMFIPYPSFKVEVTEREYILKSGVLNPKFTYSYPKASGISVFEDGVVKVNVTAQGHYAAFVVEGIPNNKYIVIMTVRCTHFSANYMITQDLLTSKQPAYNVKGYDALSDLDRSIVVGDVITNCFSRVITKGFVAFNVSSYGVTNGWEIQEMILVPIF